MPPSETWRAPRLRVLANGAELPGVTEATVIQSAAFAADLFRVRAAVIGPAAAWAAMPAIDIDIQVALDPIGGFVSLLQGVVDAVGLDPIEGVVTLEGRDYTARLIEARIEETFANRTASEIATLLAARHNLAADVVTTTTPVGRYWELEHDSLTLTVGVRAMTAWDLLAALAGWEGFDLWISGTTLHFRPPDAGLAPVVLSAAPTLAGPPDFAVLRLERALTFASDIIVTVKSWHSRLGAGTVQSARTNRDTTAAQEFVYVVPNLTPDAALRLAGRRLAELAAHEWVLRAEMPGELALSPRSVVQLIGTATAFDRLWRVTEIERTLSVRAGFRQWLRAQAASD